MFSFLKTQLSKIYTRVTSQLQSLFSNKKVDGQLLSELERVLLEADTGIATTRFIIERLRDQARQGKLTEGEDLKEALAHELKSLLQQQIYQDKASVYLLVGVNGTGKTTLASKLAYAFKSEKKRVVLAAADTFRAAATQQLYVWAERTGTTCITGAEGADPASVVFNACDEFKKSKYDILIIDTAGRLQNKTHLMRELEKVRKVISKHMPDARIITLLTIDAMLGQNSFDQAKLFNEATHIDGIALTKMDGTGKGGIVFAIAHEIKTPIAYMSYGERMDQLSRFNPITYVDQLLEA
jgi:fused signal recognition particle receptor